MNYKDNSKFNLTHSDIDKVISYVKEYNKGVRFEVSKSPCKNSNSFYITIYYKDISGIIRISDHDTNMTAIGAKLKSFVIGKSTKIKNICNLVQERIYGLKYKSKITHLDSLFDKIKKDRCNI